MASGAIGILGGTFNPVHTGHLILAQCALETLDLEKVLFVPCASPPHKDSSGLASARHRMAMLESAIEEDLRFELCDLEIKRGGRSYSIDTVKELRSIYSYRKLHFIVGTDTLPELHLWKDVYELLELCSFAGFARPGFEIDSLAEEDLHLDSPWPGRLLNSVVSGRLVDISSADIRYRVTEGMSIRYLVPSAVEMYIAEHGLYVRLYGNS
jgi:nicotinate-nucleotide adenylyltransferase